MSLKRGQIITVLSSSFRLWLEDIHVISLLSSSFVSHLELFYRPVNFIESAKLEEYASIFIILLSYICVCVCRFCFQFVNKLLFSNCRDIWCEALDCGSYHLSDSSWNCQLYIKRNLLICGIVRHSMRNGLKLHMPIIWMIIYVLIQKLCKEIWQSHRKYVILVVVMTNLWKSDVERILGINVAQP